MLAWLRNNLTYANAMSTIAVIFAVGTGSAYAANTIFSGDIVDGEVKTPDLATGAVDSTKVKNYSLNSYDIQANSLGSGRIAGLTGDDITDDAITGADIDESSLGGLAPRPVKFVRNLPASQTWSLVTLAQGGPWTVQAYCRAHDPSTANTSLAVAVKGPGTAQWSVGRSANDGTVVHEHGGLALSNFDTRPIASQRAPADGFGRVDQTAYLYSDDTVAVLEFNGYADNRSGSVGCVVVGQIVELG